MFLSKILLKVNGQRKSEALSVCIYDETNWWGGSNQRCHPELRRWRQRQKYKRNAIKYINNAKKYYLKNKEEKREYGREHYRNNSGIYAERARARKKNIKSTANSLSKDQKSLINSIYKWRDFLNSFHSKVMFVVDHINPLSNGGLHTPDNLRVTTMSFNAAKRDSNLSAEEFGGRK